eukprot:Pgem_evm1s1104
MDLNCINLVLFIVDYDSIFQMCMAFYNNLYHFALANSLCLYEKNSAISYNSAVATAR